MPPNRKIEVHVKPNAKHEKLETIGENRYKLWVSAPPVDGKANEAVLRLLAEHLGIPKSKLSLVQGASGKRKLIEVKE